MSEGKNGGRRPEVFSPSSPTGRGRFGPRAPSIPVFGRLDARGCDTAYVPDACVVRTEKNRPRPGRVFAATTTDVRRAAALLRCRNVMIPLGLLARAVRIPVFVHKRKTVRPYKGSRRPCDRSGSAAHVDNSPEGRARRSQRPQWLSTSGIGIFCFFFPTNPFRTHDFNIRTPAVSRVQPKTVRGDVGLYVYRSRRQADF